MPEHYSKVLSYAELIFGFLSTVLIWSGLWSIHFGACLSAFFWEAWKGRKCIEKLLIVLNNHVLFTWLLTGVCYTELIQFRGNHRWQLVVSSDIFPVNFLVFIKLSLVETVMSKLC